MAVFFILREKGSGPIVSQNGISASSFATNLITKYDTNFDGKLSVSSESFKRTELDKVIKVESRGLLFTDADQFGNADGSVSIIELQDYLHEFDTDGDGELTTFKNIFESLFSGKSEWGKFDDQYGERVKYEGN